MQALEATLGTASAPGTVSTNTASSASYHPPLDTPVPVRYENLSGVVSCPENI